MSNSTFWTDDDDEGSSTNSSNYPSCIFYNETSETYEDNGCIVYKSTDDIVLCACRHTTLFTSSYTEFAPDVSWRSKDLYLSITFANLMSHPLGLILAITWIFVGGIFILIGKRYCIKEDKPLIAQKGAIFTHHNAIKQDRRNYRSIQEFRVIYDDKFENTACSCWKGCLPKSFHLWLIAMRNDHIWFGICFRHYGTSFTTGMEWFFLLSNSIQFCANQIQNILQSLGIDFRFSRIVFSKM